MKNGILLPVYYGKRIKGVEKPQPVRTTEGKGGLLSFFKNPKWFNQDTRADDKPENEYFYKPFEDWRRDSNLNPDTEKQPAALVVDNGSFRYEMSEADLEKIKQIKDRLHQRLSPLLEGHGLKFVYKAGGGPEETPKNFAGTICWVLIEKKFERKLTQDRSKSLFRVEAAANKMVYANSGKTFRTLPYVTFRIKLKLTAHHEFLKIPLSGIGAEFLLEELLAVLEKSNFKDLSLPSWSERLDWYCGMIDKYQSIVFKPLPESILEAVFNSIRSRAIKVEN